MAADDWSEERVRTLILLWDEGVTTAEIGRRIGLSKNAVIGKVHRLGLTPRVVIESPALRRARQGAEFPKGDCCRYPYGHPGEDGFRFCGARVAGGGPYCAEHRAVCYLAPGVRDHLLRKAVGNV